MKTSTEPGYCDLCEQAKARSVIAEMQAKMERQEALVCLLRERFERFRDVAMGPSQRHVEAGLAISLIDARHDTFIE